MGKLIPFCFCFLGLAMGRAEVVISEFLAINDTILADEDGDYSDWVEIWNRGEEAVDLAGYFLTDDAERLTRWTFPSVSLEAGEYLVVFASDKNRRVGELHTNFKLSSSGEYLGLVEPDGVTVVSEYAPRFPEQWRDVSFGSLAGGVGFFDEPTPGMVNGAGRILGPIFREARTGGERPGVGEEIVVTARVEGATEVRIFYNYGLGPDSEMVMASADGENFVAVIPGGQAGELVRWKFLATDGQGRSTKHPPFFDPLDSHEYFGVPVMNPAVESRAEVLEWFIKPPDYQRLQFFQPVRAGVYFLDEYYDNVEFTVRGQSSAFFAKKGYNLDFNKTQRFRWREGEGRVKDFDLLTNWGDKSKSRNELAYEILGKAGVPTHECFTVRVQMNRNFHCLADAIDDGDDDHLERVGLDSRGAFYKATATELKMSEIGKPGRVRKITRKNEGLGDLDDLIRGVNRDESERWNYVFDHVDLPMTVNTLAGLVVIMQTDMGRKNYYLYRDTEGSEEWAILPWDLDLSFGRDFTSRAGYFDRNLFFEGYVEIAQNMRLVEMLIRENSATRAMFYRRLRTLADEFLASDYIPNRLDAQLARLDPDDIFPGDAFLDFEKWGTWWDGDPVPKGWNVNHPDAERMEQAVNRLRFEWLPLRRLEIFGDTPGLPAAASGGEVLRIGSLDFFPISGDQDQEYVEVRNVMPTAVDASGWRVSNAIRFTFPPGTVIPAGSSVYLCRDKKKFRSRDFSPTGAEQRLVIGPYAGRLDSDGETIELWNGAGELVDRHTYSGARPGFNGDAEEDRDGDGLSALMEWALGSSDRVANGLAGPGGGEFRYPVRADLNGFAMVVEWSEDLENWTNEGLVELGRLSLGGGMEEVRMGLPDGAERGFLRLRISRVGGE